MKALIINYNYSNIFNELFISFNLLVYRTKNIYYKILKIIFLKKQLGKEISLHSIYPFTLRKQDQLDQLEMEKEKIKCPWLK